MRLLPHTLSRSSMRYKIAGFGEIRTENAAKPPSQPSNFLLNLIHDLERVEASFDYGCGKLRYEKAILGTTNTLAVIDSEIQISRNQTLYGKLDSIRNVYARSNRVHAYNDIEFKKATGKFQRGFCINVLSVIPSYRQRLRVLVTTRKKLHHSGECLFVVQYRNSDFNRMRNLPNARPWLDGFIVDSLRGHSFYGLITPQRLERSLKRAGFLIRETKLNEGSAYCWAHI